MDVSMVPCTPLPHRCCTVEHMYADEKERKNEMHLVNTVGLYLLFVYPVNLLHCCRVSSSRMEKERMK